MLPSTNGSSQLSVLMSVVSMSPTALHNSDDDEPRAPTDVADQGASHTCVAVEQGASHPHAWQWSRVPATHMHGSRAGCQPHTCVAGEQGASHPHAWQLSRGQATHMHGSGTGSRVTATHKPHALTCTSTECHCRPCNHRNPAPAAPEALCRIGHKVDANVEVHNAVGGK